MLARWKQLSDLVSPIFRKGFKVDPSFDGPPATSRYLPPRSGYFPSSYFENVPTLQTLADEAEAIPSDHWLASFPFTNLPLELQLHIGRFTVEYSEYITIYCIRNFNDLVTWSAYMKTSKGPVKFGLAPVCHAFHAPLMQHFYKANTFKLFFHRPDFPSLYNVVSSEHQAMIQSVAILAYYPAFLKSNINGKGSHFRGVRFLDISTACWFIGLDGEDKYKEVKLSLRSLFQEFPRLEKVSFVHEKEPKGGIAGLRLRPGAKERGAQDVMLLCEEENVVLATSK